MACDNLACLSDSGCVGPMDKGVDGQIPMIINGKVYWVTLVLDALGDVSAPTPAVGDYLRWDGSNWISEKFLCTDLAGCSINALADVNAPAPANGDALVWNGSDWVPGAGGAFSCTDLAGCSINALADVDTATTTPAAGDTLVWNGSAWVPGDPISVTYNSDPLSANPYKISYDSATRTLNIPRPTWAFASGVGAVAVGAPDVFVNATGLLTTGEASPGLTFNAGVGITVNRAGRYKITASTASTDLCASGKLYAAYTINGGAPQGRYVGIQGGATAVQAVGVIGPIALAAGDVVRVSGAIADCASATIAGAYLGMELVE